MNKDLVYSVSDSEFKKIVRESYYLNQVGKKLGFKHTPGGRSKKRISERMESLNLSLKKLPPKPEELKRDSNYGNTKDVGFVGEKYFEYECAKNNIIFLKTSSDNLPYDYLIWTNDGFKKVQVKTAEFLKSGGTRAVFNFRKGNYYTGHARNYSKEDTDLFYLFSIEGEMSFLIDFKKDLYAITIRLDHENSRQNVNINRADELRFIDVYNKRFR